MAIEWTPITDARCNRVLIVTSVSAERDAVLRGLDGDDRFTVVIGGVGTASAAIATSKALSADTPPYDLVVSAGIAGGFAARAAVGSVVVASEIIAADLGAETPDGFMSVDELGFGATRIAVAPQLAARLTAALQAAGLVACSGPILTLSTVTGTAATAAQLEARIPGAAAEAMEGYGVALAAQDNAVAVLEVRAISNAVGPRDRAAWRIPDALVALQSASAIMREVL